VEFAQGQKQPINFETGWSQEYERRTGLEFINMDYVYVPAGAWRESTSVACGSAKQAVNCIFHKCSFSIV
jgi:hypothetical protein